MILILGFLEMTLQVHYGSEKVGFNRPGWEAGDLTAARIGTLDFE